MDHTHPLGDRPGPEDSRIVYIRPVKVGDLPDAVKARAEGAKGLYAVHDAQGQRLALVQGRELAFVLARQNDLTPVNVH